MAIGAVSRVRSRTRHLWLPAALFLVALAIYVPTVAQASVNTDAYAASVSAWRIATTGSPVMDEVDTSELSGAQVLDQWLVHRADGSLVHNRMGGVVAPAIPIYWLFGNSADPQNFSIMWGGVTGACFAAGAVVLFFLTLRRYVPTFTATAAAGVLALTTPTWTVSANGLWPHSVTQFALAGAAWALSRNSWLAVGIFLGVGITARPHLALVAAIVGIGMSWTRRDPKIAFAVGIPSLSAVGLLLLWNHWVFGVWNLQGGYDDYVVQNISGGEAGPSGGLLNLLGFLVSPDRGLLIWSPMILILLPALIRSWSKLPAWTKWLLVGGIVYTLVQLRINSFTGGLGFYGYRHGLELLTCLAPAIALSFDAAGSVARKLLGPIIGIQFAAITVGASVDGFFVLIENVWRDNSFWLGLRDQPAVLVPYLLLCAIGGLAAALILERRRRQAPAL